MFIRECLCFRGENWFFTPLKDEHKNDFFSDEETKMREDKTKDWR